MDRKKGTKKGFTIKIQNKDIWDSPEEGRGWKVRRREERADKNSKKEMYRKKENTGDFSVH